ncbi:mitochondrial ribosomal death-associated protein 3-domain-containing protein [Podospora australis]|uniref:Small ribosomal subunit protein mS29 n=1 Tax=Podospora australis TaxID=1536484 RepID=A0AAN6X2R7_9PEZI|nr:mitochondrial ribosomal death-associated protein 3-domain-containing protein [Podospora australis]
MSAPNCLRCLGRRPSTATTVTAAGRCAPFSTTAVNGNVPMRAKTPNPMAKEIGFRSGARLTIKKKKVNHNEGKAPAPGERKAYRKKIVLSNDNALPVPWLKNMNAEHLASPQSAGKVLSLPSELQDQLRASEAFQPSQNWGFFRKPSTLVRTETVDLVTRMQDSASEKKTLRLVVTGSKLVGKSTMLLQAMAHAYLNGWIVIHIPDAQELVNASTEYGRIPETEPTQYMQPAYALKLLQAIKKANEKVLAKINTVSSHPELPQNIPVNTPLLTLVNAAKEAEGAWPVFHALWSELTNPNANRPPVLFSLDGLSHIMKMSEYRSPSFELIHAHDLAFVRLFNDVLSGNLKFPNGGAVLASTSRSNAPRSPSMEISLAQRKAEQAGAAPEELPKKEPYFKGYDDRVEAVLKSVEVMEVKGLTKPEARSIMEYWAASGMLRAAVDERTVSEKWTLAGNGVLGELERASLLTMKYF